MSSLQTAVGENVRRLRTIRGLTQSALAEAIGRSTDLVSRIERGDTAPSFGTIEKLCAAFGVTAATIFGDDGEPLPTDPVREALARLADGMTAEDVEWLAGLLRAARERPRRSDR